MSYWWIILLIVVVLVGAAYVFRSRRDRREDVVIGAESSRDYQQEREATRNAQMSDEDRTWQAASLQKNRDTQEQKQPPTAAE